MNRVLFTRRHSDTTSPSRSTASFAIISAPTGSLPPADALLALMSNRVSDALDSASSLLALFVLVLSLLANSESRGRAVSG